VADVPDQLVLRRHRDLEGGPNGIHVRRSLLVLLAASLVAGLLNVFGQRPGSTTVRASAASLELSAPSHLRGGLLYAAVFTVKARRTLRHAALVFSPGWATTQQINTIEPSPAGEMSRDGQLTLQLGKIRGGSTYRLFMQFQVDPTSVGRRAADVSLYDGTTRLIHIDRTITVFP
jgi:hypothetical protein